MNNKNVKFLDNLGDHDYLYVGLANRDNTYKIKKKDLKSELGIASRPLVYTALLTQTAGGDPEIKILENTLGDFEIIRFAAGTFDVNCNGLLTIDKTTITFGNVYNMAAADSVFFTVEETSLNENGFRFVVNDIGMVNIDNALSNTMIKIEVYP